IVNRATLAGELVGSVLCGVWQVDQVLAIEHGEGFTRLPEGNSVDLPAGEHLLLQAIRILTEGKLVVETEIYLVFEADTRVAPVVLTVVGERIILLAGIH